MYYTISDGALQSSGFSRNLLEHQLSHSGRHLVGYGGDRSQKTEVEESGGTRMVRASARACVYVHKVANLQTSSRTTASPFLLSLFLSLFLFSRVNVHFLGKCLNEPSMRVIFKSWHALYYDRLNPFKSNLCYYRAVIIIFISVLNSYVNRR